MCEDPSVFSACLRKARRAHRCCECRGEISIGEAYEYASGIWDGSADSFKTCMPCAEQRNELLADLSHPDAYGPDACIGFGELREQWREFWDVRKLDFAA